MASINLLTIHYGDNNGSVLQTYSTYKLLCDLGHDVTVIDLWNRKELPSLSKLLKIWYVKGIYRRLLYEKTRRKFIKKWTPRMSVIKPEHIPSSDYTIIGSDQVWNRDITSYLSLSYFLDFVPNSSKRIALSSSFGKAKWEEDDAYTQKVKSELEKFSAVSVRELSGVRICKDYFGINATCLIDPTLALHDFSEILSKQSHLMNEVGCFTFKPEGYSLQVAAFIANRESLAVRHINKIKRGPFLSGQNWRLSPEKWLEYISQSKIFVTDSFHGVACSIILRKQFVAVCADEKKFERISSLLTFLKLNNKIVLSLEDLERNYDNIMTPIDYDSVFEILNIEKQRFIDFLSFIK